MTTETIAASDRRIVTLDVIRGVAVMGILSVNIVDFSMMQAAYLNPAAFSRVPIVPASGAEAHPGNLSRYAYRLPSVWNVDASVAKSFALTERAHIQFRADFLNAFNHTNLMGLTTNINSGSFGRFTSATARNIQLGARIQF